MQDMGTGFKAASGRAVNVAADGSLMFGRVNGYLSKEAAYDAEEYFRAKHDEELGRWRWPINPHWIAMEGNRNRDGRRTVALFNEQTFESCLVNDRVLESSIDDASHRAGRAFFEAHPELKPWHDAKAGEFWSVHHVGIETCRVDDVNGTLRFVGVDSHGLSVSMPITHHSITAAVRMIAEVTA